MGVVDDFFSGFVATIHGRRDDKSFKNAELHAKNINALASFRTVVCNTVSKNITSSQISSDSQIANELNVDLSELRTNAGRIYIDQNINVGRSTKFTQTKLVDSVARTIDNVSASLGRVLNATQENELKRDIATLTVDNVISGVHKEQSDVSTSTTTTTNIMREVNEKFVDVKRTATEEVVQIMNRIVSKDAHTNKLAIKAVGATVSGDLEVRISQQNTTLTSVLMDLNLGEKILQSLASVSDLRILDENRVDILQKDSETKVTESRVDSVVVSVIQSYFMVICFFIIVLLISFKF